MMIYCKKCERELASNLAFCNFCGYEMEEGSTVENSLIEKAAKRKNKMVSIAVSAIAILLICLYVVNGDFIPQFEGDSSSKIGQVNYASGEVKNENQKANGSDFLLKEGR